MTRKFEITNAKGGAAFSVRVVTRAAHTEIVGIDAEEGLLKVRLVASPAGADEANEELIGLLSGELGVLPNQIEIVAGREGRDKLVSVEGITTRDVEERLGSY